MKVEIDENRRLKNTGKDTSDFNNFICEIKGCANPVVVISEKKGCFCKEHRKHF